ncbi:MAG TPA: autoinducer binding domain-containing protein [Allosphingosinicella sp.]
MAMPSADLARRAFDGIAAMKVAPDVGALSATAGRLFGEIGLPSFALTRFFARDRQPDAAVISGDFNASWSKRYIERRYVSSSSIAREMLLTSRAYSWDEVMRRRPVDAAQVQIRNEAGECGLRTGLFTPVGWHDGSYSAVVLAGADCDLEDGLIRTSAEILSAYYGSELRRLISPAASARIALSARQRECLAWVRQGKSSGVIADILGLSSDTVEEHIAAACAKLGVRTRVQAAVEACMLGLID